MCRGSGPGGNATTDTFDANLSYMSISRPLVSVMENVEALDDAVDTGDQRFQSNLKQVEAALKKNGFIVMSILLSSNKYGLPQMRKRFYILATPMEQMWPNKLNAKSDMFHKLCAGTLVKLEIDMLPLDLFYLDDDSALVTSELERLQRNKEKADQEDRASFPSWPQKHQEIFTGVGLRLARVKAPAALLNSPWYAALPDREREIVLFAALSPDATGPVMQTDCSQSITRLSVNRKPDVTHTLTPGMVLWCHKRNRLITPWERLSLQAVPYHLHTEVYQSVSPHNISRMAGNAFSGTVCFAALLTCCAHVLPNVVCEDSPPTASDVKQPPRWKALKRK